jgi:hypothetical protein
MKSPQFLILFIKLSFSFCSSTFFFSFDFSFGFSFDFPFGLAFDFNFGFFSTGIPNFSFRVFATKSNSFCFLSKDLISLSVFFLILFISVLLAFISLSNWLIISFFFFSSSLTFLLNSSKTVFASSFWPFFVFLFL